MPACSSTCRGGSGSRSSTFTPHNGARKVSGTFLASGAVQGPAASATAPAGWAPAAVRTPVARPSWTSTASTASPIRSSAPASRARSAQACVAEAGGTGRPVASRYAYRPSPTPGSAARRAPPSSHSGATSGKRARSSSHSRRSELRVVGEHERADRLGRIGEAVAEGLVERQRALVHAGQCLVERVLEHAGVAPGGGRGDRLALVQAHARAGLGEQRGERRADDPTAGDRDVGHRGFRHGDETRGSGNPAQGAGFPWGGDRGGAHGRGTSGPPESSCASTSASSSETSEFAASQHAIGAARRSEAWAATEASFKIVSCCPAVGGGCPRAAARASIPVRRTAAPGPP